MDSQDKRNGSNQKSIRVRIGIFWGGVVILASLMFFWGTALSKPIDIVPGIATNNLESSTDKVLSNPILRVTNSVTSTLYMPLMQGGYSQSRQLGVAQLISGPVNCEEQQCYQLKVTCPNLSQSVDATLKVGDPFSDLRGTILFTTGWTGTYYWDGEELNNTTDSNAILAGNLPPRVVMEENEEIIEHLRQAGFRTVQLKWTTNWFKSQMGIPSGIGELACRPATIARWVYDNLHKKNRTIPYCATGHSNGASQIAYAISQYELYGIFSGVVYESGPNWSRVDFGCLHNDPIYLSLYGEQNWRNTTDWGFGFNCDGTGPCAMMNTSYLDNFEGSSLALGGWAYFYPSINVAFVFGGADTSSTAAQGMYFHDLLVQNSNANISMTVVPNAPHFTTETPEGAQAMEDALLNTCQIPLQ